MAQLSSKRAHLGLSRFARYASAKGIEPISQLLISAAVRDALGEACNDAVSLGEVAVRGYDRPMTVWQLG